MNNRKVSSTSGFMSASFMILFSLFALLVLSLFRYQYSLFQTISKQAILIEAERMAFQQLDIYPECLKYDRKLWILEITIDRQDTIYNCINVTAKHTRDIWPIKKGYSMLGKKVLKKTIEIKAPFWRYSSWIRISYLLLTKHS